MSYAKQIKDFSTAALAVAGSGLSSVAGTPVATDNVITILSKFKYLYDNIGVFVRAVTLAGLSTATNSAITASDTVLSALGKLQSQITANALSVAADTDLTTGTDNAKYITSLRLATWFASKLGSAITFGGQAIFTAGVRISSLASTGNTLLATDSAGNMINSIAYDPNGFTQDSDLIASLSAATWTNNRATVTPGNSKSFSQGIWYADNNYVYFAIALNVVKRW